MFRIISFFWKNICNCCVSVVSKNNEWNEWKNNTIFYFMFHIASPIWTFIRKNYFYNEIENFFIARTQQKNSWVYCLYKNTEKFTLEETKKYYETINYKLLFYYNLIIYHNKKDDKYIVKKLPLNMEITLEDIKISKYNITYVEYSHHKMKNEVCFPNTLLKQYYVVGNELFTPEFVLKCLKETTLFYHFDNNYKITIIDEKMNNIELSYKNYLYLGDNYLSIKTKET